MLNLFVTKFNISENRILLEGSPNQFITASASYRRKSHGFNLGSEGSKLSIGMAEVIRQVPIRYSNSKMSRMDI